MYTGELLNNKYQVISRISIKGFRQKWLATDVSNNNTVIIETLHDDLINDEQALDDFRYELSISQMLKHELFPSCVDTFLHESRIFLVWENYDNETLSSAYKHKAFKHKSEKDILLLIARIAQGMSSAHQHNIIHGNLNGENITINPLLIPKVSNFSLNKTFETTDPGSNSIFSSINLAAPEIKNNEMPNPLSDFYSIAMIAKLLLIKPNNNFKLNDLILRVQRKDLDLSVTSVIDALCSDDLTLRSEAVSRILDKSFLDPYRTPPDGIEMIKVSNYKKWKLRNKSKRRKNG